MIADTAGEFENLVAGATVTADDPVIVQNPDLHILKRVDQFFPLPGETITYTLDITNRGAHFAQDVWITDILPI